MSDYHECESRDSCDDARDERDKLQGALRILLESLAVVSEGGIRIVGIPNLNKFWQAYDAAERLI